MKQEFDSTLKLDIILIVQMLFRIWKSFIAMADGRAVKNDIDGTGVDQPLHTGLLAGGNNITISLHVDRHQTLTTAQSPINERCGLEDCIDALTGIENLLGVAQVTCNGVYAWVG